MSDPSPHPQLQQPQPQPSQSPAQLAHILSSVLTENENLRRDLNAATRRSDRLERLLAVLSPASDAQSASRSPPHSPPQLPEPAIKAIVDLEARLTAERNAHEDTEARLRALTDAWTALDRHLQGSEHRAADARDSFTSLLRDPAAKLALSPMPPFQLPNGRRPPPPPRAPAAPFPPYPPPPPPSRIRHRAESTDDLHPPAKRLRADRAGRYPHDPRPYPAPELHPAYPHPTSHARAHRGRHPSRSPSLSPTRSRSRSSSMSLDDLLLQVATDVRGSPAPAHAPLPPYYRHPDPARSASPRTYPPPARAQPPSPALGATQVQYQTHIFAPPVTGPPGKKPKGPAADKSVAEVPPPPVARVGSALPPGGFPAVNDRGQRICRQCGMPGRYKEGKCVEKWGPGPAGPGTVCDRCRKKMKRVERRGTLDPQAPPAPAQALPHAALHRADTLVVPRKLSASPPAHRANGRPRVSSSEADAEGEAEDELADGDAEGEGEGEGEDGDADADLLEAVDAAEGKGRDGAKEKEKVPWVKREGDAVEA